MANRDPLTPAEKDGIYQDKMQGQTLAEVARSVGCTLGCARKWWRQGRDHGLVGLRARARGRSSTGILSHFAARVRERALDLKRQHPRWGARRVLVALRWDPELQGAPLPGRSRLAAFFKRHCPEHVATRRTRPPPAACPLGVTGVHEEWQLDAQEGLLLAGGQRATICNIRDPIGAAMIASQVFEVTTARHWRKLNWVEYRQVLRDAFSEWKTLPDSVRSDNELGLAGSSNDIFPGRLTLWLVGLGIKHRLIRPGHPTDQPHIERNHRTLADLALDDQALIDVQHLQQALDRERSLYNTAFPSEAGDCAGRPPLQAHPELLHPRRPYHPDQELALFDLQRVYDHLATFEFGRKVNADGRVSLGRVLYSVGRRHAGQTIKVQLDPERRQWVFLTEAGEIGRQAPKRLTVEDLTGVDPSKAQPGEPVQLTLPFFVA